MRRTWLVVSCLVLPLTLQLAGPALAAAEGPDGSGDSYWGPIPARADSVSARIEYSGRPAWAVAVDLPYEIVRLPFRGLVLGAKSATTWMDHRGVIYRISRWLKPRELPFGVMLSVSAGGLAGFGGGATAVHDRFFGENNRFRLGFKVSTTHNDRVVLGIHLNDGQATQIQTGAGYRLRPNARYFGIGPGTREEDESFYTHEMGWVGGALEQRLVDDLTFELSTHYTAVGARKPREEEADESLTTIFPMAVPPGYGTRSEGVTFGLALTHDTTTQTGTPGGGLLARVGSGYFLATDGSETDLLSSRAELQTFIPLWFDHRALALRGFLSWIEPIGRNDAEIIPFQRLMTNDDPDVLRGFRDYRWRDRGMAVGTVEYRWPIWAGRSTDDIGVHMYLFTDIGQVYGEKKQLAIRNLTESFGTGLRVVSWGRFVGRAEIAFSDEGTQFRLRADQVFQFQKGTLYHGRNPIPLR